jgi:hypothetical protein
MAGLIKPSETFAKEILPAYQDCLANPLSERHANIAAKAVSDQMEWVFNYYQREESSRLLGVSSLNCFRLKLFAMCPDLRLLWDAGDASKHRFLTRPRNPPPLVAASSSAYTTDGEELLLIDRPFLPMLEAAVEFWRSWPD